MALGSCLLDVMLTSSILVPVRFRLEPVRFWLLLVRSNLILVRTSLVPANSRLLSVNLCWYQLVLGLCY